jgi:hypothetical protein
MRRIFNLNGYVEHCLVDIVSLTTDNLKNFKGKKSSGITTTHSTTLQPCTSVTELQLALQTLRETTNLEHTTRTRKDMATSLPIQWLPGEYVPWPVECDQVTSYMKEKRIYILSSSNEHGSTPTTVHAVIFLGIGDHGSSFAGIVAATWPSLVAAVDHALELENGCTRLYIDRCDAIDQKLIQQELDEGLRDYIVVYKPYQK